jgi:hypothetical protein
MAPSGHFHHSRTSAEVRAGNTWSQDNPLSVEARDYDANRHRMHNHARTAEVRASIPYMRYGVHNNELLNKFFYYDPCASTWIIRESSTHALESTICLLEQQARSSGGLSYRGILNHHIVFDNGDWIPAVPMASQSPLRVERRAYIDLAPKQGDETTTEDPHGVKVIETEQRTVGHQAPQKPMSFISRRDDNNRAVVHCKRPRKPPDKSNDTSCCLEPYVSTWSRDRGGGAVHGGNEHRLRFVREQKDALDMLTSSSDPQALVVIDERDSELVHPIGRGPCSENRDTEMNSTQSRRVPDLKNNGICCSMNKNVSKRRVVPPALPPAVLMRCSPRSQPPTRPKTRFEFPYGPQVAVCSIPPRSREESYSGSLDDAGLFQNEEKQSSAKENVNEQRTVPMALSHQRSHMESSSRPLGGIELHRSDEADCPARNLVSDRRVVPMAPPPAVQMSCLPVSQRPTRLKACYDSLYGPQVAVSSRPPKFREESRRTSCRLGDGKDRAERRWAFVCVSRCSVRENVSGQRTVPEALSPYIQVKFSPVILNPTCLQTRYDPTYSPQMAISLIHL